MRRILLKAGAVALVLAMAGGLTACNPDDVAELALPTIKAGAVKLAIGAARGETRSREALLSVASGYCEVSDADRLSLREAFAVAGRPAFAVDCGVVAELRGPSRPRLGAGAPQDDASRPRLGAGAPQDDWGGAGGGPRVDMALLAPTPHRRE